MTRFRFQIAATVCFDVEAADTAEARKLADRAVSTAIDGMDLDDITANVTDCRVYLDDDGTPEVIDMIEAEEATAEDDDAG